MLVINYNGKKPSQREYEYSIVGNVDVDTIRFVLQSDICSDYTLENLASFDCYVKVQSAGKEYIDKILVSHYYQDNCLFLILSLEKKSTHYKNIALQLQFENGNGEIVAQTEIVALTLSGNIEADKEISHEYPYAIQQLEGIVSTFDGRINQNTEDIAEIKAKGDCVEISTMPNIFENENGIKKIVRKRESNGSIEKSYLINKKVVPSTLVKCEPSRKMNGYDYNSAETEDLINDLGHDNFYDIFGENAYFVENGEIYSLYYNESGNETVGVRFGNNGVYGAMSLPDCEPNKIIKIVVGKYFEYDEHGNKVFDEQCGIYSESFAESGDAVREITQERQEFLLKTDDTGRIYFDSDDGHESRFILYEISAGEEGYTEYTSNEINTGVKFLPIFKPQAKGQDVYDYWEEHHEELGTNGFLSFVVMESDMTNGSFFNANFSSGSSCSISGFKSGGKYLESWYDISDFCDMTIDDIVNNLSFSPYAYENNMPNPRHECLPMFSRTTSVGSVYDYYISNKNALGLSDRFTFCVQGDENDPFIITLVDNNDTVELTGFSAMAGGYYFEDYGISKLDIYSTTLEDVANDAGMATYALQSNVNAKLDKTTAHNKLYGTTDAGEQTTYDINNFSRTYTHHIMFLDTENNAIDIVAIMPDSEPITQFKDLARAFRITDSNIEEVFYYSFGLNALFTLDTDGSYALTPIIYEWGSLIGDVVE